MNTVTPTTAKAYFLTDGTVRDKYGDTLFHPLSNVNNIEIYIEDGDSDNVVTINYNPEIRKKWATHWWPCFYRGLVEHTLDGESEPRTFAQYITTMPNILSSMNQNSETAMSVNATLRQQAGNNLIGSYSTVASLPTSYPAVDPVWLDLQDMEENDVVAYVYEAGVNGFYMVEYDGTYAWTLQTSGISNYVSSKQYDIWELSVQAGFGNPAEITELPDEQYRLIWQELSSLSAYYSSNYELIQDLIDGTTPVGKAVADQNGNVINTTYQLLSNLVTAFQVTPDDTHYASEKLIYDTIQNILDGTTPFTAMTLYNANGNAVFTIDDEGVIRATYSDISHELGENLFVRGDEVGTILNGDTIMFDGSIGASGKMNVVTITSANIATLIANTHYFVGVATQDFTGIQNRINWYGGVSDLDTTSYPSDGTYPAGEGKIIYVDMVNGGLTYIRPAKPLPVIKVGLVVTYHATQGKILIRPKFSVALGELHDVDLNGGVVAGDIIKRNAGNTKYEAFNLTSALSDAVDVTDGKLDLKVDKVTGSSLVTDLEIAHLEALDTQTELDAKFALKEDKANKGAINGYAPLNSLKIVPAINLPSYIDNIVEYDTYADLPATGVANRIYVVIADETSGGNTSQYRWATTVYVMISNTMSGAEIKALYEIELKAFTDALFDKLATIETNAKNDQTGVEIKALYEAVADTNAFTDAMKVIIDFISVTSAVNLDTLKTDSEASKIITDFITLTGAYDLDAAKVITDFITVTQAVNLDNMEEDIVTLEHLVLMTYVSSGQFKATVDNFSLSLNRNLTLLFPNTLTDLTTAVQVSFDNGVTYKYLKYDDTDNDVLVKHTQNLKTDIHYDNTEWFMKGEPLVPQEITFDSIMNSTYGLGKPIKGISELVEAQGLLLNQMFPNGDFADTSEWTIGSRWSIAGGVATFDDTGTGYMQQSVNFIDNNTYFLRFEIKNINTSATIYINGDSGLLFDELSYPSYTANGIYYYVLTANQNATVLKFYGDATSVGTWDLDNFMCIDITNTPLYNHTAPQINNIVQEYIEGPTYNPDFELSTIGVNLFDKSQYTAVDYAYKIEVLPSQDYKWAESIAYKLYDIGENELSSGTSTTVTTTSSTAYIAFANTIADTDAFILNEGTVLKTYAEFNSPETNFKLIDFNGKSVGTSIWDKAYYLNGKWWKDEEVGTALAVAISDVIDTTAIPTIKETTGKFYAVDTVNNESQYGTYGDTLTLTGTATVYFELATVVTTELEKDGSLIQESNTTLIQHNNFATNYTMKFANNANAMIDMLSKKVIAIQQELDDKLTIAEDDLRFPLTLSALGSNTKPDYDSTNLGLLFPEDTETEIVYITAQMPHAWEIGTDIEPHVHCRLTQAGQPVFVMEYKWYNVSGATIPATWSEHRMTTNTATWSTGTISNMVVNSTLIDGTGFTESSILLIKLYRETGDGYTGDVLVDEFDIHYKKGKFGIDV